MEKLKDFMFFIYEICSLIDAAVWRITAIIEQVQQQILKKVKQ